MKKKAKNIISNAAEDQQFTVADGRKLSNFIDLANALETMDEDVFKHHVNEDKNDFGNWAKDVFNESELADEIAKKKNRTETQLAILKHVLNKFMQ